MRHLGDEFRQRRIRSGSARRTYEVHPMTRFFIDRPIFSWVISIVILLGGAVAVFVLPVAQYPEITPPTVTVSASYPGANAQVVADSVAAPIEQQVNGVDHMLYMSSQCTNDGSYNLTVTFEIGTDPNINQVLVQNRVSLALAQLPTQVQIQGINVKKKSPDLLLAVNLYSPAGTYDDIYLSNYATTQIKDELLRLPGVGDITYLGQRDYSMRVWLDPEKMATLKVSASDIVSVIQKQNVQVAAGQIGQQPVPAGQQLQLTMSTLGRLEDAKQFGDILIKSGTVSTEAVSTPVVRVRDVGRVELGAQQYDQICRLNGQPSVGLGVFQLPGSNALDVAEAVKKKMAELKKRFPKGLDYKVAYDTTPFIDQSVEEVFNTLRDAVILVAIVVLLFLQDWKAMILPMIDVPVSLVGTFAVMALLGFTLNNLTLFGLVLAIGIVVDDAIVVLENIEHHIAAGLDARAATIKAMGEITGPIIAITLVLISVFLPAAFLPGISGQFYRQFALTIASAMVISAVNAMTLTPSRAVSIFKTEVKGPGGREMKREALPWWSFALFGGLATVWLAKVHVAALLGLPAADTPEYAAAPKWLGYAATGLAFLPGALAGGVLGWFVIRPVNFVLGKFFRGFNWVFDLVTALYGRAVASLLRVSVIVLLLYGGLLFLTYWNMTTAPQGFLPEQDQGYLLVNVQLPDAASVQRTSAVMKKIERIALGDDSGLYKGPAAAKGEKRYEGIPGVANTLSISGTSFLLTTNASNLGTAFVTLKPFADRKGKEEEYDAVIAARLNRLFAEEIDGAVVTVFRAPPIRGLGNAGGFKLQVEQRGFVDLAELQKSTYEVIAGARGPNQSGAKAEPAPVTGLFTIYSDRTPQLYVDIDRTQCEKLGVDLQNAFDTLQVYMGTYYVNLFNKFGRTWQVNLSADQKYRTDERYLKLLKVRNGLGRMVPLGAVADVRPITGPVMVMRYNMYTSAPINGAPAPGVSSGQALEAMEAAAKKSNVTAEWTELAYLEQQQGGTAVLVFLLGTVLVFLVLSAQYESWSLPLAIILVVPMCILCAVTGMLIVRMPVDIFVQIGFLVLAGLAAKNAILIVEFARQLQQEGKTLREAVVEASRLRLRPILMTSFAFIAAMVPLVLSEGAGAEMRQSLGTAVFFGMIGVTLFGIFLTPVFFYVIRGLGRDRTPARAQTAAVPSADQAARAPAAPVSSAPV
jgi:multidrug efflux pump